MLSIPANVVAALSGRSLKHAWLVELPAGIHATTYDRDVPFAGITYSAQAGLISVPSITRERELKSHTAVFRFAADGNTLNETLSQFTLTGQLCFLRLVFLDDAGEVIDRTAINMYRGKFHKWSFLSSGDSDMIDIHAAGGFSKPNQTAGRMTSQNSQQDYYAGDMFFEFAHEKKDHLGWGGEA